MYEHSSATVYADMQPGHPGAFEEQQHLQLTSELGGIAAHTIEVETPQPEASAQDDRLARRQERMAQNALIDAQLEAQNPFNPENAYDPEARAEAMTYAHNLAEQSLLSRVPLTATHAKLARQLKAGEISRGQYDEQTFKIAARFALYNPASLQKQQDVQHRAIDRHVAQGKLPRDAVAAKVNLVSQATREGVQLDGVEAILAKRAGVTSYEAWNTSLGDWRKNIFAGRFGGERLVTSEKISTIRKQQLNDQRTHLNAAHIARMREIIDEEDRRAKKKTSVGVAAR